MIEHDSEAVPGAEAGALPPTAKVHQCPHLMGYLTSFRVLRWLATWRLVRAVLDLLAYVNERFLERLMGGWGHWMYEHRVFKYLYLCLGTAWVFGQAIVTHFPGRQRGGQGEAGPGCRVVRSGV